MLNLLNDFYLTCLVLDKLTGDSLDNSFPLAFSWQEDSRYFDDESKHVRGLCVGLDKWFVFARSRENADCIFSTEPSENLGLGDFFQNPEERASFQNEKIIKILSLTKNLKFSSFYIFILTKRNDSDSYFLYLLNENFESTKINVRSSAFIRDSSEFRIIDFSVCEKPQDKNSIPIVFIVKYLYHVTQQNQPQNLIAYAAFFRSLNEDEVMINNILSPFFWNNKIRKSIFFVPNSFKDPTKKSSDPNERPTLIQFSPPYFIYFRNRMFNAIIMKKDNYQSLTLNDQPLRTAFCQFIHQAAALFVFNEVISIIDFSKQLNLPVHIFPYGKLHSDSKFHYEDNILYIFSQNTIYKVPILSTQVSDFSNIFSIQNEKYDKKPNSFTIACHNFILQYGNEFRIAKPKNAGTFAATMLIQNGNAFDCITSLDNQPTRSARSQAYRDCFLELWKKDHKEEALMVACNPHFDVLPSSVISLFEIFNEPNDSGCFSELNIIEATFLKKKEDNLEIYKRLKFYLDQYRQRFKEKGAPPEVLAPVNSYIIMYLCYFHKQKELIDFLKTEKIENQKDADIVKKVEDFFSKFKKECNLDIEESLFYSGIGSYKKALELFKKFDEESIKNLYNSNDYHFSPRMEAIKILKQPKSSSKEFPDYKWIFEPTDSEPDIRIYYYLPSEEDYDAEVLSDSSHDLEKKKEKFKNDFDDELSNWICKYYIEWLRCKGLDQQSRLKYATDLFNRLKDIQDKIVNNQSRAQKFLNENKEMILWINSINKYFEEKSKRDKSTSNAQAGELNAGSSLEAANKEIEEIIREVIIMMKKYPDDFESFKRTKGFKLLIDMQEIDNKKSLLWLIEDYKEAIELESEGTTSESQIIKKCKEAINPAKAFECFDETHKDILERKSGKDKYEWEEKIEFIGLADFIKKLDGGTPLKTAAPFLSSAISLMTSRIHNLEQRVNIQKQVLAEEKMMAVYDQISEKVEKRSQKALNSE